MNKSPRGLHLEVNAGLCNRLRAMVSGMCWANKLGWQLIVYWPDYKAECGAEFSNLFDLHTLPPFVKVVNRTLPNAMNCLSPSDANAIFVPGTNRQHIEIKSHGQFWDSSGSVDSQTFVHFLRMLKPSKEVIALLDKWPNPLQACHIRRTDNIKALRDSPLELFHILIEDTTEPVFVFSDDPMVATLFSKYPTVILPESVHLRSTREGMIEATAVFFALAGVSVIFGSAGSSFSEMAAAYGGNRLKIVSLTT